VCADPNNLPFSNERQEGFENRIATVIAADLHARLEYTWFPQRRGFIRNTLRAGLCDAVVGVPDRFELTATTRPYYRSTYVFVTRQDSNISVHSLDDAALRKLTIGVHVIGDDYANPPPMHALARRNIIHNVSGYTIYGDYSQPNPPARLIEAVASREVDVAIVWGPLAGYFSRRQSVPLKISAVSPESDGPAIPLAFNIALGVRKDDTALRTELEGVLDRRSTEISSILTEFGVPMKPLSGGD
jgi:mxaJ protein